MLQEGRPLPRRIAICKMLAGRDLTGLHGQMAERVQEFSDALIERLAEGRQGGTVVDRAKRLGPGGGADGQQAEGGGSGGGIEEFPQEAGRDGGHVAGQDEIPLGLGGRQSRADSRQRAGGRKRIGDHGKSQAGILLGVADEGSGARSRNDCSGDVLDQKSAPERQQSFVPPHSGTGSTDEHEAGSGHRKMVTLGLSGLALCPDGAYN